jgi:hypothetical protein
LNLNITKEDNKMSEEIAELIIEFKSRLIGLGYTEKQILTLTGILLEMFINEEKELCI